MGNGIGKLQLCFAGDAGEISRRRPHHHHHDIAVYLSDPLDEGLGHSFCYIRPDSTNNKLHPIPAPAAAFRTISGASISANTFTPLSTALLDFGPYNNFVLDKAASFESSDSFASIPLQPIPRSSIPAVRSGPIHSGRPDSMFGSGPIERGFLSGPIERSLTSGPLENQYDQLQRYKPKSKKISLMKILKKSLEKSMSQQSLRKFSSNDINGSGQENEISTTSIGTSSSMSNYLSGQMSLIDCDEDEDDEKESTSSQNLQWAQGKAGEDRIHVVISEENGWDFVGIYDGFNGPDATDFLLNNLYKNVHKELKGILFLDDNMSKSTQKDESLEKSKTRDHLSSCDLNGSWGRTRGVRKKWDKEREEVDVGIHHSDVLKALSEALRKTEEAYLEIADLMLLENPELALMGSCLLVMLMKGDDVYLMNVGDSRAVLARKEESFDREDDEFDCFPNLDTCQLSVDHSTSMDEEVRRIKSEHRDDPCSVTSDRVKGSLKVTRAFGAGFLKQPKWNNALLPMFRIDYVGTKPYINCVPSLYHHRLGPRDKFLILSSDGLYQYFTNEEAVNEVEMFISTCPEGDPAQHLVEQVLFRAAKKAGMDFHELIDIPQGDRRKYHDDVSIIIISFEGRIWRSSM